MKKFRIFMVALLVVAVTCAVLLTGCGEDNPPADPDTYTVTVTGGTADKTTAEAGETIILTQGTAPDGSEFLRWTVNGENITGNTFEMPAKNVTAVAVYGKISYAVTVTGGTADKQTAQLGDTVTLTPGAAENGKRFTCWMVNDKKIEGNTFVMTAAAANVVAVYETVYSVTVTGGSADKTVAAEGESITLTAANAAAGYKFSHFTLNGEKLGSNSFEMPAADAVIEAVFVKIDYTVTVTGGTADKTTAQIGDTVTLTPDAAPDGQKFSHWTIGGTAIEGNTFEMTAANATVAAVFVSVDYNVIVTGGTADKQTAHKGDTVTLTPGKTESGKRFKYWTVNGTQIEGNTFVMTSEDATVVAVYETVYAVTVTGCTADKAEAAAGEEVVITANEAEAGYEFSHFTLNGEIMDTDRFVMPAEDVNVTAVFVKAEYTVKVTGGTADKDTAQMGDLVTLTATDATETKVLSHWTVNGEKIDGNTFEMPGANAVIVAVYVELVQKIATPNNTAGELIFPESDKFPCPIALDRADNKTNSMFTVGTDHVLFYIYDDVNADTAKPLGTLKMTANPITEGNPSPGAVLATSDGTLKMDVKGQPSNYYIDGVDWNDLFKVIKHELGYKFGEGRTYYFAAQSIAKTEPVTIDGFDITFTDSDVSVIGTKGIAKDPSKPDGIYNVSVKDGFINGSLTALTSGYGNTVELSTTLKENHLFNGWYLTDENGNKTGNAISYEMNITYTVTGDADIVADFVAESDIERTKLVTPNNTASKMIGRAADGAIELDRDRTGEGESQVRNTMFTPGVSSVIYYIYSASDADTAAPIGRFRMRVIPGADAANGTAMVGWVETIDGAVSKKIVRGTAGDYYIDRTNANEYYDLLKSILGYNYSEGQTYYYAAQTIAAENTIFTDSEISVIGEIGFAQDANKPSELFTVTVLDGKIDGTETMVTAGYGVKLTLTAEMPEGKDTFLGWKIVTYDDNNAEVLGDVVSYDLPYTMSVNGAVTLRPVFANSGEITAEKLAAPDNSKNQMIVFKAHIIEYDRQTDTDGNKMTAFALGVSYIEYYIYESNADDAQPIASFKLMKEGEQGYFLAENGTRFDILGGPGNYYTQDGNAHNFIKNVVVGNWNNEKSYYFACRAVSADKLLYEDSDIGAKGQAWGAI